MNTVPKTWEGGSNSESHESHLFKKKIQPLGVIGFDYGQKEGDLLGKKESILKVGKACARKSCFKTGSRKCLKTALKGTGRIKKEKNNKMERKRAHNLRKKNRRKWISPEGKKARLVESEEKEKPPNNPPPWVGSVEASTTVAKNRRQEGGPQSEIRKARTKEEASAAMPLGDFCHGRMHQTPMKGEQCGSQELRKRLCRKRVYQKGTSPLSESRERCFRKKIKGGRIGTKQSKKGGVIA